jgi:AcrR family transcriptional regulator
MHVSKRRTQAERRATTRAALLEAAARGLSRYGYGNLILEQVAKDAGYTRGALYHLFDGKEDLARAVVKWVATTWEQEVWWPAQEESGPAAVLLALARGHIVYCRREVARSIMALRVEFGGREHSIGRLVETIVNANARRWADLITAGRAAGEIPPGPPAEQLAAAAIGALEGLAIQLAGAQPRDEELAERVLRGLLGLPAGAAL